PPLRCAQRRPGRPGRRRSVTSGRPCGSRRPAVSDRPAPRPGHARRQYRSQRRAYLRPTSIFVILSLRAGPRGTLTATVSLRLRPISARPTGDSLESLFSNGLASAEPTIVYLTD